MNPKYLMIFIIGEVGMIGVFFLLNLFMNPKNKRLFSLSSILKGILERGILLFALLMGFNNIIMFFAAIKLGTRLDQDKENKISNDYFLVGNLVSIGAVMVYIQLIAYSN